MQPQRSSWKRKVAGWSLLTVGVAGLVLPLLNGTIFLLLGLFILRDQHSWSRRCLEWCDRRWPGQMGKLEKFEAKAAARFNNSSRWLRRKLGRA
ncbi:MAG TPA: PGPGW domain-containing protein [Roseomonas sp.]|nr:PGPGW domain-containing protein [Roseomonas sp.]